VHLTVRQRGPVFMRAADKIACRLKIVLGYRCLLHGKSHDPSLAQVSVGLFAAPESPRFVVIAEAFRVRPAADNLKLCAAQNCVHNSGLCASRSASGPRLAAKRRVGLIT
jgi:hypothetical protein